MSNVKENLQVNKEIIGFFDLESSRIITDCNEVVGAVYLWNFKTLNLETGEIISKFGRRLDEAIDYMETLGSKEKRVLVFCHNLYFEKIWLDRFGFTTKSSSIFRDKNSPYKVIYEELENIEFRCSYALSRKSLKQLALNYNMKKLEYDYNKERTWYDKLDQLDYDYNENDNDIVLAYIKDLINKGYKINGSFPVSANAMLRRERSAYINSLEESKTTAVGKILAGVKKEVKNFDLYDCITLSNRGGAVGANHTTVNKAYENVYSADIKSSYPYTMATAKFPRFTKENYKVYFNEDATNKLWDEIDIIYNSIELELKDSSYMACNSWNAFACIVEIEGLKIKSDDLIADISISNCLDVENTLINYSSFEGKILKADKLKIAINTASLASILTIYDFENINVIGKLHYTKKTAPLHILERHHLLDLFNKKENLEKGSIHQQIAKEAINSLFGNKVRSIIQDEIKTEFGITKKTKDYKKLKLHERKEEFEIATKQNTKNYDLYSHGIWICALSRFNLNLMQLRLVINDFKNIYIDTDSVKFVKKSTDTIGSSSDTNIINTNIIVNDLLTNINDKIISKNASRKAFKLYKIDKSLDNDKYNKICTLGIWEIESIDNKGKIAPYKAFKTLGSKRYGYIKIDKNGQQVIHTTIAGCSRNIGYYLTEQAEQLINKNRDRTTAQKFIIDTVFQAGTHFHSSMIDIKNLIQDSKEWFECMEFTKDNNYLKTFGGCYIKQVGYTLNSSFSHSELSKYRDIRNSIEGKEEIKRIVYKNKIKYIFGEQEDE